MHTWHYAFEYGIRLVATRHHYVWGTRLNNIITLPGDKHRLVRNYLLCVIFVDRYRRGQILHQITTPREVSLPSTGATDDRHDKTRRGLTSRPCPLDRQLWAVHRCRGKLARPPHHPTWEEVATKQRHHEAISPSIDPSIVHLTASVDQRAEEEPRRLQNRIEHRGSLQPTSANRPQVWTHQLYKSLRGYKNN
jgi:hypothetical protein